MARPANDSGRAAVFGAVGLSLFVLFVWLAIAAYVVNAFAGMPGDELAEGGYLWFGGLSLVWMVAGIYLLWAVAGLIGWMRRRGGQAREAAGLCPKCGYDLRASTGSCPECDFPIWRPRDPRTGRMIVRGGDVSNAGQGVARRDS